MNQNRKVVPIEEKFDISKVEDCKNSEDSEEEYDPDEIKKEEKCLKEIKNKNEEFYAGLEDCEKSRKDSEDEYDPKNQEPSK